MLSKIIYFVKVRFKNISTFSDGRMLRNASHGLSASTRKMPFSTQTGLKFLIIIEVKEKRTEDIHYMNFK